MSSHTIWIIEDNTTDQFILREILEWKYEIRIFDRIDSFVTAFKNEAPLPNLLIVDIRLPDGFFTDLFKDDNFVKTIAVPFMVVSSFDATEVLNHCFEQGALDYITKPYNKNELLVKVERVLRNLYTNHFSTLFKNYELHYSDGRIVSPEGVEVELTKTEMNVFDVIRKQNGPIDRRILFKKVWGETKVCINTLDVHLSRLREKLQPLHIKIQFLPPQHYFLLFESREPVENSQKLGNG